MSRGLHADSSSAPQPWSDHSPQPWACPLVNSPVLQCPSLCKLSTSAPQAALETVMRGDCSVRLVSASFQWPQDFMPSHRAPATMWVFWEGHWAGSSAAGWGRGSPGRGLGVSKDRQPEGIG